MKLSNKFFALPASLSLISPISLIAGEINFADVNGYSSSKQVKSIGEFSHSKEVSSNPSNFEVLEPKVRGYEAGSFSETTTLNGSVSFQTGAVDESDITQAITSTYSYDLDLNTSFTGEDNLYVGIETGNDSSSVAFSLDSSGGGADYLSVTSLYYQFPLGEYDIAVGPLLDADDLMPTLTSKYSDSFYLSGALLLSKNYFVSQGTGAGIAIARTFDNGINASASVIGTGASSAGFLTDEGADIHILSLGYDKENYGGGFIYASSDSLCTVAGQFATDACNDLGVSAILDEGYTSYSVGGYWDINENTTLSATVGNFDAYADGFSIDELQDFQIGIDHQFGAGVLSASWKTVPFYIVHDSNTSKIDEDDLGSYLEVYYTYEINDSLVVKPGFAYALPATDAGSFENDDVGFYLLDQNVYGIEATFKF